MTPWELKADEFVNCNCDWGCPCQFNSLPTRGHCEAVAGYKIISGRFADTTLDGLQVITVLSWPGAIHEGGGRGFAIIDERADGTQRAALLAIVRGEETDPGATMFNVFAATMAKVFDPVYKPIGLEVNVEQRTGRIVVEGLLDCQGEPIRNPVTGEQHRARIDLPDGFEFTLAEIGSGSTACSGPVAMSLKNTHAQFAHIHLGNHGVVRDSAR